MITNSSRWRHQYITFLLTPLLAFGSLGCGKPAETLAGGKPVKHWVQALQNPDARQRKQAVFKLGNVGPADPAVLPALIGGLEDRDPLVRKEVVLALMKYGPAATEAVPGLMKLSRGDRDPVVRNYAARAIKKLEAK